MFMWFIFVFTIIFTKELKDSILLFHPHEIPVFETFRNLYKSNHIKYRVRSMNSLTIRTDWMCLSKPRTATILLWTNLFRRLLRLIKYWFGDNGKLTVFVSKILSTRRSILSVCQRSPLKSFYYNYIKIT